MKQFGGLSPGARKSRGPALARWLQALGVLLLVPLLALGLLALAQPSPSVLLRPTSRSVRVLDRHGKLLRELRTRDGRYSLPVRLESVSPYLVPALIAAEDARFRFHPGVDPLAMVRAAAQAVRHFRVVSGASTLTQQLAKALVPRPRSLLGKLQQIALAVRLEASLDKDRILAEYLDRVEFGPNLVGVEAASSALFDKPAKDLDLSEAATLVGLLRGPTLYDPRNHPERARARRDYVLSRLRAAHAVSEQELQTAEREPIVTRRPSSERSTLHLAFAIASGALVPDLRRASLATVETTIDAELQSEVETIARRQLPELALVDASALAVLVVDNAKSEVLAYVGSPDYFGAAALGGNDGTRALRQPGSTLKPFLYAAAMAQLGFHLATLLPDTERDLQTSSGLYRPKNYDGREHGPVRLRVALGSSLNLPALFTAQQLGPGAALAALHRFGFASLERDAEHYGAGIALGDGEVRLSELAAAYASLARDGEWLPLRYASRAKLANGAELELSTPTPKPAVLPEIARQITDVLADEGARAPMFGLDSALRFPFPAAAKTGTSKAFRDNWAIAYTKEITVAVWVGNFDGRPLVRSSGVSGAGPLLHEVMLSAMRGRTLAPLLNRAGLIEREVCALSGELPTAACPVRTRERFKPGRAPSEPCSIHQLASIPCKKCPGTPLVSWERYPPRYDGWAQVAGRPLAPRDWQAPDSRSEEPRSSSSIEIEWPRTGQRFVLDPSAAPQQIVVTTRGAPRHQRLRLFVDDRLIPQAAGNERLVWPLTPGRHSLRVGVADQLSAPMTIDVVASADFGKSSELAP